MVFCFLGATEVAIILVIALLVFGPQKLPEVGKQIGSVWREMNRMRHDVERMLEIDDYNTRYDRTPYCTPNDTIYPQISGPLHDTEATDAHSETHADGDTHSLADKLHDDVYLSEGMHHNADSGAPVDTTHTSEIADNGHSVSQGHTNIPSEAYPPVIEHDAGDSVDSIAPNSGVKEHKNDV